MQCSPAIERAPERIPHGEVRDVEERRALAGALDRRSHAAQQTCARKTPGRRRARLLDHLARRTLLHDAAFIHHDEPVTALADDIEVVGDQDECAPRFAAHRVDEVQHLRLHGRVERRRRFVGDEQIRREEQRRGDEQALPHATGELMREHRGGPARVGDADAVQHRDRALVCLAAMRDAMHDERLHQVIAGAHRGIECLHRFLEDHRDATAAQGAHLGLAQREQVDAIERDVGTGHPKDPVGQEPHEREPESALACARTSHKADAAAPLERERDAIEQPALAVASTGGDGESLHPKRRLAHLRRRRAAARRSAAKFAASTVRTIASVGKSTIHQ